MPTGVGIFRVDGRNEHANHVGQEVRLLPIEFAVAAVDTKQRPQGEKEFRGVRLKRLIVDVVDGGQVAEDPAAFPQGSHHSLPDLRERPLRELLGRRVEDERLAARGQVEWPDELRELPVIQGKSSACNQRASRASLVSEGRLPIAGDGQVLHGERSSGDPSSHPLDCQLAQVFVRYRDPQMLRNGIQDIGLVALGKRLRSALKRAEVRRQ